MHKYLLFLAVLLAVLGLTTISSAQSRSNQRRLGEAPFAAGSNPSPDLAATGTRHISAQARALAKQSYQMGVKYARAGLYEQAAQSFEKAVQSDPTYADAHYGLGNAYLDLKEWHKAVKSFEQAVRFNAKSQEAQTKLAEARLKLHIASNPPRQTEKTTRKKVSLSDASSPPSDAGNSLGDVNRSPGNVSRSPKNESVALRDASNSPKNVSSSPSNSSSPVADASSSASNESNSVAANSATPKPEDDPTRFYRVGVGDVLDVRLGDAVPAQSTLFTVTASGLLEHPNLADPLPVSSLTVEEIKMRLEEDLKRRAITDNPKVAVSIREYLSHAILVSGLVKEPGTKLLRREAIPLYVVVADAQPLPEAGRLILIQNEGRKVLNIDLSDSGQMNMLVRSGDVITVQRNPTLFFYLGGEVKSPGEKPFRHGLTLTQAILVAEGLTSKGKEAHLAREKEDGFLQVTRYKLKDINSGKLGDPLIQPGDRITIVD